MKTISWINKYASLSLVIGPILEPYNIPGTSLAVYKVFMLFNIVLFFLKRKNAIWIPNTYNSFVVYAFTIPILNALAHNYMSHLLGSYLTLTFFSANLLLSALFIDLNYLKKYYKYLIWITCGIFFAQEASFIILGRRFMALIPFLEVHYEGFTNESFAASMSLINRSCSCFLEPSHFAQYILPFLAFTLGELHEKNKEIGFYPILITVALLILRSGVGLLTAAALWSVFIIFSKRSFYIKALIIFPLVAIMVFVLYAEYSSTEEGAEVVGRVAQLNPNDNEYMTSGIIRVYRGYWVYGVLDYFVQLFGVGIGGTNDAIDQSSLSWMFWTGEHYLNNVQTLLIGYGIVGTIIFSCFLFKLTRKTSFIATLLVVAFIATSLMESYFYTSKMLMYIAIPFVLCYQQSNPIKRIVK